MNGWEGKEPEGQRGSLELMTLIVGMGKPIENRTCKRPSASSIQSSGSDGRRKTHLFLKIIIHMHHPKPSLPPLLLLLLHLSRIRSSNHRCLIRLSLSLHPSNRKTKLMRLLWHTPNRHTTHHWPSASSHTSSCHTHRSLSLSIPRMRPIRPLLLRR